MRSKTYLIAFVIVFLLFIAANFYSYVRMSYGFCDDCFISFGFPFPLWEEGGFATVRHILWSGLIADLSIAIWTSILLGWVLKKILLKVSKRESSDSINGAA